jgi:sulfate adenylyltransferase subunit 2
VDLLEELENRSIYIFREAFARLPRLGLLWSAGKDSTVLLWLARKAFFGRLPFPVIHVDTSYKFPEIYEFRDRLAREWGFQLVVARNDEALARGMDHRQGVEVCCQALKTEALARAIEGLGLAAVALAIRRDEHGIRAKERVFSPRSAEFTWNYQDQPAELWDFYRPHQGRREHTRVHPMLDWTERDVWRYVEREKIPVNPLYLARQGRRYRSIGCRTCCAPIPSAAGSVAQILAELQSDRSPERAGRAQDKEDLYTMQKLRSLGYM